MKKKLQSPPGLEKWKNVNSIRTNPIISLNQRRATHNQGLNRMIEAFVIIQNILLLAV